jgi:hypothetical protein
MITGTDVIRFKMSGNIAGQIYTETMLDKFNLLEKICYHEAAHYIQTEALGRPAVTIGIDPSDLSGFVATVDGADALEAASDDDSIAAIMKMAPVKPDLLGIEKEVRIFLLDNWTKIERIARELRCRAIGGAKVTLTRGQVERLFWTPAQWTERYGMNRAEAAE